MYRSIINDLATWYDEPRRRILCIKGAIGVGKTWTVKDFATGYFENHIYISMAESNPALSIISTATDPANFSDSFDELDAYFSRYYPTYDLNKTIIILDDIEHLDNAEIFFREYARRHRYYSICLISNNMQISGYEYHHKDVFKILRMRPMTFEEYMIAKKATPFLAAISSSKNKPLTSMEENVLTGMLRDYLLIGGMPEIVHSFIKDKDFTKVRALQNEYLDKYNKLIKSRFNFAMSQRMRRILRSIPPMLTHENKKFMYKFVEENARSREYSEAVQHLCDLGIVRKLPRLMEGRIPLEDYVDYKSFELFMIDHGLLRAFFNLDINESLSVMDIMSEENGAVAEQYVFQELSSKVGNLYYWISGATARVPFVYDGDSTPVPVDIRFIENKKAQNVKTFRTKYPETEISIKISMSQVYLDNKVLNIPAYGLWNM